MEEPTPLSAQARGEATRERLVAAAYGQFLQGGYHGTSMRKIADAAGVAVGGIYNHFPSKESVFEAVLDQYHPYHLILPVLEQSQGETLEGLLRSTAGMLHTAVKDRANELMPLVFIELVEFQGRHLSALAERVMPVLLDYLQRLGARSRNLRPIDPLVLQRAFLSFFVGHFFSEYILRNSPLSRPTPNLNLFEGLVDIFLNGVVQRPGEAPP